MAGKIIKTVRWVLDKDETVNGSNLKSATISILYDRKVSKWCLNTTYLDLWNTGCFNGYDGSVSLSFLSGSTSKPIELTLMVLDQVNGDMKKSSTAVMQPNMHRNAVPGTLSLVNNAERMDYEKFMKNGKLNVICEFRELPSSENKQTQSSNSKNISEDQMFRMMTLNERDMALFKTSDGHEWKVYKKMVSEKSSVFKKMFESASSEQSCLVVEITRYSSKVMEELLRFILLGRVNLSAEIDIDLYDAAKAYKVDELKALCLDSIKTRLSCKNVSEILQFVVVHDETESDLYESCCEMIFRCFLTEGFKEKFDLLSEKITGRVYKDLFTKMMEGVFCEILQC